MVYNNEFVLNTHLPTLEIIPRDKRVLKAKMS